MNQAIAERIATSARQGGMKAALRKLGTDEEIEAVIESIGKSAAPAKVGRYRDSDGVTRKVRLRGTLRGNVPVWVDDIEV